MRTAICKLRPACLTTFGQLKSEVKDEKDVYESQKQYPENANIRNYVDFLLYLIVPELTGQ